MLRTFLPCQASLKPPSFPTNLGNLVTCDLGHEKLDRLTLEGKLSCNRDVCVLISKDKEARQLFCTHPENMVGGFARGLPTLLGQL